MGKKVLVVEDDDSNYELVELLLVMRDCTVTRSVTGEEALREVHAARPDIVVTDMGLPDMDGKELVARMRASPQLAGVVVVCVSGHAGRDDIAAALAVGCSRYIVKPIDTRRFADEVLSAT